MVFNIFGYSRLDLNQGKANQCCIDSNLIHYILKINR